MVSLHFGGTSHVSNGQHVSFQEPYYKGEGGFGVVFLRKWRAINGDLEGSPPSHNSIFKGVGMTGRGEAEGKLSSEFLLPSNKPK